MPYTIILYPIIFIFMARLWSVSHRHGYVTTADFVRGRYDSRVLSLAVAVTGFVATMPYIALQLVGIQAVLEVVGLGGSDNWLAKDLPLLVAFVLLAAYTYTSGLRAPAVIAFVKDALIYLVIIVAIIYLPHKFGGWGAHLRRRAGQDGARPTRRPASRPASFIPGAGSATCPATGPTPPSRSARRWRCSCTPTRSRRRCPPRVARRSGATPRSCRRTPSCWACWPCSAGWPSPRAPSRSGADGKPNPQLVIPQLFEDSFPSWFAGVAFAAVAIGALVPAAIMSIAAANTFTRNIYKEWIKPNATHAEEAKVSKLASLVVKAFALLFVLTLDNQNAINFQLLGGIWILQTFPAIVFSLYTRWFHRYALLAGWAVGMVYGTVAAYQVASPVTKHFGGSLKTIPAIEQMGYIAVTAFVLNVVVAVVLSAVLRTMKVSNGADETTTGDYFADAGDPRVEKDKAARAGRRGRPDVGRSVARARTGRSSRRPPAPGARSGGARGR